MSVSANTLLITGNPGIGKTTVVKKVLQLIHGISVAGFYTEEMRSNNIRKGFELVTLQGKRFVMAHVDYESSYRVGRYGVDVAVIDKAVEKNLPENSGADLYIIDEIGKMECFSSLFVKRVSSLLDAGIPLVATIALKGGDFIASIKHRPEIELWEITAKNRDDMPERITKWLTRSLRKP